MRSVFRVGGLVVLICMMACLGDAAPEDFDAGRAGDAGQVPPADSGRVVVDAGQPQVTDAGSVDAGSFDAGHADAGPRPDAGGATDAGRLDAGLFDAGPGHVDTGMPRVTLAVAGAPNLPLNGTTTQVTVGFATGTPAQVELSRDGFSPFATWPTDAFFTLAGDQRSLTGNWCISSSCWGDQPGAHTLTVLATYAGGATATASVQLNVQDAVVDGGSANDVEYTGVTADMWSQINTQRASFGDPNDCQARVEAIPSTGGVTLSPGDDINAALASHDVVFLSNGTYHPSKRVTVLRGTKLVGVAGHTVTLDMSSDDYGVIVQNDAVLANVIVDGSLGDGVTFFDSASNSGSTGALVYQVSSRRSGYFNATGDGSAGIRVTQNAANDCIVSSEAFDTWNVLGAPNDHGGNSDGVNNSFGAHHNTFIDVHSYRNGDDGFDLWKGGASYWYFSAAHDNGKTTGQSVTGDGNGIKLGVGDVVHKFYKTTATNNKACGYDLNGNLQDPLLVQCPASGNPTGDYCYFTP